MLKLRGKTGKGRNRIRENGAEWEIIGIAHGVFFDERRGPWWFVRPVGQKDDSPKARWIHSTDDKDFAIEETEKGAILAEGDDENLAKAME